MASARIIPELVRRVPRKMTAAGVRHVPVLPEQLTPFWLVYDADVKAIEASE
jgi:hypothetical protein